MSSRSILCVFVASAALLGSGLSQAASDKPKVAAPAAMAASQTQPSPAPAKLVDINSASKAELKTLPGIGDAEAERIIAARPYPSKAKLGADKVVPDATYLAIKSRIVAVQPAAAKPATGAKASAKP